MQPILMTTSITQGQFRRIALWTMLDLIRDARAKHIRESMPDDSFRQGRPAALKRPYAFHQFRQRVDQELEQLGEVMELGTIEPEVRGILEELLNIHLPLTQLLPAFERLLILRSRLVGDVENPTGGALEYSVREHHVTLTYLPDISLARTSEGDQASNFLSRTCRLIEVLRHQQRNPTFAEYMGIQTAYDLLRQGATLSHPYRIWGNSGFRDIQTYMSVTDPGEGHIFGTCDELRFMNGVIIHIEHLERGNDQNKTRVEAYRIPDITTVGLVRLHAGNDAPCSSYVGRPVFEAHNFHASLLKAVNTVASSCTALFGDGLAECKIAIEGMKATEAVEFMQCLTGMVRRDRTRQYLSAAFNINTPIVDDRDPNHVHVVTDRFQLGLLGIELAHLGGFEKATWDGAADTYPSTCILEQLSQAEALTLVHRAHEKGLLTYFSAGFRLHHLAHAVAAGVDGVGVGGAQILRYMDRETGYHGPFKPENILEILRIRDEASQSLLGRAAHMLARLDRMYYEGCITERENEQRVALFDAMLGKKEHKIESALSGLAYLNNLPPDSGHPLVHWAQRLIDRADSSPIAALRMPSHEWGAFVQRLKRSINDGNIGWFAEEMSWLHHGHPLVHSVAA